MAKYTEENVQNALADLESGVALATAATRHGVPRNTLRGRFKGAQPHRHAHDGKQRLKAVQEEHLERWILQQEALGYAPTHAQVRAIAIAVLKKQGDHENLGKKWTSSFVQRHPAIKSKLGRRISWGRVNGATPESIRHLFDLYETVSWIPPQRRYNADEGGITEGINGLVVGSSQENPNAVPVKTKNVHTWISVVECISAIGVALDPFIIFKAKSTQEQCFKQELLAQNPGWHVTFSQNGWTSTDIAVEWLEKVFLPQTEPDDPSEPRLLIVDGHSSHTSDEFMTTCYLNNVCLLFLPRHTSHILGPLDLGCSSSLKAAYQRFVYEYTAGTDKTKLGKAKFLQCYAEARKIGLGEQCIRSGWKTTGLYPKNVRKPLSSHWVVVRERPSTPPPSTMDIRTQKRGSGVVELFPGKKSSPNTLQCFQITSTTFDPTSMVATMQDREIASLHEQGQANPPKRRKVATNLNNPLTSLAKVSSQANKEPSQHVRKVRSAKQQVIIVEEESSPEEAQQLLIRRSARNRQPTRRYLDRD